jgi:hypothetical protein
MWHTNMKILLRYSLHHKNEHNINYEEVNIWQEEVM